MTQQNQTYPNFSCDLPNNCPILTGRNASHSHITVLIPRDQFIGFQGSLKQFDHLWHNLLMVYLPSIETAPIGHNSNTSYLLFMAGTNHRPDC